MQIENAIFRNSQSLNFIETICSYQPLLKFIYRNMCCTSYLQRKRVETQLKICKVCQIWQNCLSGKTRKLRRKISRIDSCPFLPTSVHFYLSDSQYRSQLQWTIRNEPLGVTSIISRVQFSCAFFNSDIFLSVYFYHLLWNALNEIIRIKHFDNIFPEDSITPKVPPDKTTGSLYFLPWLLSGMCGVITRGSEADLLSSMSTPQRSHLHLFYSNPWRGRTIHNVNRLCGLTYKVMDSKLGDALKTNSMSNQQFVCSC